MGRVSTVTREELESDDEALIISSLQPGKTVNVYGAIGNNVAVLRGFRKFLGALWTDSGLTDRQREIVILTAAAEVGSEYEWHQHVSIATDAGLDREEIAAIARDDRRPFVGIEQMLVGYTRAVARGRVTDVIHAAALEYVDEETLVGVASTAAGYVALGRVIDSLGVEIEAGDDFVGWDLR